MSAETNQPAAATEKVHVNEYQRGSGIKVGEYNRAPPQKREREEQPPPPTPAPSLEEEEEKKGAQAGEPPTQRARTIQEALQ